MAISAGRMIMPPEWAMQHRRGLSTSALAKGIVYDVSTVDVEWHPFDNNESFPGLTTLRVPIYHGPMRVQPNKDWRSRKQRYEGESVTEHAYRIQIPFWTNELAGTNDFPDIHAEDVVEVLSVSSVNGVIVDSGVIVNRYTVRNLVPSSNSWWRTLLCDVIVDEEHV